jgi:hypothetical protein
LDGKSARLVSSSLTFLNEWLSLISRARETAARASRVSHRLTVPVFATYCRHLAHQPVQADAVGCDRGIALVCDGLAINQGEAAQCRQHLGETIDCERRCQRPAIIRDGICAPGTPLSAAKVVPTSTGWWGCRRPGPTCFVGASGHRCSIILDATTKRGAR